MKAVLALPVNKLTKADVILMTAVLILSVTSILISLIFSNGNATGFEITVDGKVYSSYSFESLKDGETIEVHTQYGYNKFLYENKSIRCIETNCKDKIELNAGTISKTNEILVCLPHRLTVQITGERKIDAVSY